jgi:hypothetical protein
MLSDAGGRNRVLRKGNLKLAASFTTIGAAAALVDKK